MISNQRAIRIFEITLIIFIVIGMTTFATASVAMIIEMDWYQSDTYFFMLRRVLALAIGGEAIKFIITNQVAVLLEILIFLLARQLLLMEINETYEHLLPVVIGIFLFIFLLIWSQKQLAPTVLLNPLAKKF